MIANLFIINIMEKLLNQFLKPKRCLYSQSDLGPSFFEIKNRYAKRTDVVTQKIPFSYYQIQEHRPTILYIHSYNSSRLEPLTLIQLLLQQDYNVISVQLQRVAYNSLTKNMEINIQGYISFGYYECEEVIRVINWFRQKSSQKIYLWGRSMGAVTALLCIQKYKNVDGVILDSPFHSLHQIFISQLTNRMGVPRFIAEGLVFIANSYFKDFLRYDIKEMDIIEKLDVTCPVFIIVNPKDSLSGQSSHLIYQKCKGVKKLLYSEAEHSAQRQTSLLLQTIAHLNRYSKPQKQYCVKMMSKQLNLSNLITQQDQTQSKETKKKQKYINLVNFPKSLKSMK